MSTVTLSKPHWAITSAEKPDGIASQPFTTALPEAHTFLTLFAIGRVFLFVVCCHARCCIRIRWLRPSAYRLLNALFAHADFAGGIHYRRPGVVRQGYPVFGALGAHFPLGIAGNQHGV